jgi:hypothetical protein
MIEDIEDNVFANNAPDSCSLFNSRCKFAELCKSNPSDRERLKKVLYEKELYDGFKIEFEDEK